jgi:hypothetical protein
MQALDNGREAEDYCCIANGGLEGGPSTHTFNVHQLESEGNFNLQGQSYSSATEQKSG